MKEAGYDHWNSPNTGATNSSGWTGLPGGNGNDGIWWSSSALGVGAWERAMSNGSDSVDRVHNNTVNGFSARCVID